MRSIIIRLNVSGEEVRSAAILEVLVFKLCDRSMLTFIKIHLGVAHLHATNPCRKTEASAYGRSQEPYLLTVNITVMNNHE
jgi:hypothetical protein